MVHYLVCARQRDHACTRLPPAPWSPEAGRSHDLRILGDRIDQRQAGTALEPPDSAFRRESVAQRIPET